VSLTSVKAYYTPNGIEEALELLKTYGDSALIVAGGSFVHGLDARDLLLGVEALIDIQNLALDQVESDSSGLFIGAMVTFAKLQKVDEIENAAAFAAVRDALQYPPRQIINVATIGGNVASACPYFDLPTALLTLDGVVAVRGANGSRKLPLTQFFEGLFQNALQPGEFMTGLVLPRPPARTASAFIKLETNANDLAIVNVAVRISLDESGVCQQARVACGGGVAETAVRVEACESVLEGEKISDDLIQRSAEIVAAELDPMSDHRASAAYRSAAAKTLYRRALERALNRLNQGK